MEEVQPPAVELGKGMILVSRIAADCAVIGTRFPENVWYGEFGLPALIWPIVGQSGKTGRKPLPLGFGTPGTKAK